MPDRQLPNTGRVVESAALQFLHTVPKVYPAQVVAVIKGIIAYDLQSVRDDDFGQAVAFVEGFPSQRGQARGQLHPVQGITI